MSKKKGETRICNVHRKAKLDHIDLNLGDDEGFCPVCIYRFRRAKELNLSPEEQIGWFFHGWLPERLMGGK